MKNILIFSGGMDSTVLLAKLLADNYDVFTLTFNYGAKHNAKENNAAREISEYYGTENKLVRLDFIDDLFVSNLLKNGEEIPDGHYADVSMKQTVVPFRNGILLSIAAGYAESRNASKVFYGAHTGDHAIYPDCRLSFVKPMAEAIFQGTYAKIKLESPFQKMNKRDIGLLGKELGVPFRMTWTCYKGQEKHCGKCGACTERREALEEFDPTDYEC